MAERFVIPDDLARAAASEGRGDWLAGLPALVARIAADWRIEVGDPSWGGAGAIRLCRVSELAEATVLLLERWLFARAVEASPYWVGMADLARTLYPLGGRFFGE